MKRSILFFMLILPLYMAAQDHLIFTELVLQPSAGEYAVIKNPTASDVDLADYYITDATDTANGKYYYKLPGGADYWSGSGSDFIARFPDTSIAAGGSLILAFGRDTDYYSEYGSNADLSLKGSGTNVMLNAVDGVTTIGGSPNAKLDNAEEMLVLFYWDGSSATVQDVDYLIWGGTTYAADKSGVSGYNNDTPLDSQSYLPVHVDGEKLLRTDETEGMETSSGGNGITGHDETSENLADTWTITELASTRPVLSNIGFSPDNPTELDTLEITATVTDETGGLTVECVYTFDGTRTIEAMAPVSGTSDAYSLSIDPLEDSGTLNYYVRAENSLGLKDSTLVYSKSVSVYTEAQTIRYLRDNFDDLEDTEVTVTAVVTVAAGLINTYTSYVQDNSGRGINVYGGAMGGISRGTQVQITGTLTEYNGIIEIEASSASEQGTVQLPEVQEYSCQALNNNYSELEGTLVKVHGRVTDRADNIGGGSNVTLDDGTASLILRIWDSTNLLLDATADSLLQPGNSVEVTAISSFYSGSAQLLPAYPADIAPWTEGVAGPVR
ncbi:MAG: hypothetical protein U5N56_03005 [Candidatus Marinimicrobia bacterium]|nr:hypothetical protein [Candidatus Neomarinimicrobiota bacterium]